MPSLPSGWPDSNRLWIHVLRNNVVAAVTVAVVDFDRDGNVRYARKRKPYRREGKVRRGGLVRSDGRVVAQLSFHIWWEQRFIGLFARRPEDLFRVFV